MSRLSSALSLSKLFGADADVLPRRMCTVAVLVLNAFHPGFCFDYRKFVGSDEKTAHAEGISESSSGVFEVQEPGKNTSSV